MVGANNGCQAHICSKVPLAFYVHGASHQFNLAVAQINLLRFRIEKSTQHYR